MKKLYIILLTLFLPLFIAAQIPPKPEPARYLNDYSGILTNDEAEQLEQKLYDYYKKSTNQLVIAVIDVLPNTTDLEKFSTDWFNQWGIGSKDNNNGILLLIILKEHKIRIEVGYGLEASVPDAVAAKIIDKIIVPNFKEKKYFVGLNEASDEIINVTDSGFIAKTNNESQWKYLLTSTFVLLGFFIIISVNRGQIESYFMPALIASAVLWLILYAFLWGTVVGSFILENLHIWYIFFGILLLISEGIIILKYTNTTKLLPNHIFQIIILIVFQISLLLLTIFLLKSISPKLVFVLFHSAAITSIHLFIGQFISLNLISDFYVKMDQKGEKWIKINTDYTKESIEKAKNQLLNKMKNFFLFDLNAFIKLDSELDEMLFKHEKYFTKKSNSAFQNINQQFHKIKEQFNEKHKNMLESKLKEDQQTFSAFAEKADIPKEYKKQYEYSLAFWTELFSTYEGSFSSIYKETKAYLNENEWNLKSKKYQNPDDLLKVWKSCWINFNDPKTVESKELLKNKYENYKEQLEEQEKKLALRNDIIIVPIIDRALNGPIQDPIYLVEDRQEFRKTALTEKDFFERHANLQLRDIDEIRLKESIHLFKELLRKPDSFLAFDIDFLKKQYELAKKWDWYQYTSKFTPDSITASLNMVKQFIKKAEENNFATQDLVNIYRHGIMKIPNILTPIAPDITYSSGYSDSSSYSDSGVSSFYSDSSSSYSDSSSSYSDSNSSYSDSSFDGGSSGGGGASGSW